MGIVPRQFRYEDTKCQFCKGSFILSSKGPTCPETLNAENSHSVIKSHRYFQLELIKTWVAFKKMKKDFFNSKGSVGRLMVGIFICLLALFKSISVNCRIVMVLVLVQWHRGPGSEEREKALPVFWRNIMWRPLCSS